jgi:hypothetical protein
MPGKVQVSGTFRTASAIKVKVAGTWRNATQAYVKIAGDWRQWFSTGVVDTFSRTTTTNLGTSESGIAWASRFGTWTANGSVAVSSNAVSSGTAGALAYVDLGNKNALTSVSTPNAGVGPAFWVTSAGSWWAAHLTSDQTNTTYTYNCNCTCNGHNETTCNSCYNSGFGTTTTLATYLPSPIYGATMSSTSSWVQTSGSPIVSTYNYTYSGDNTQTCTCPSGQSIGYVNGSPRCFSTSTVVDTIATCYQSYGSGVVNSSQPCTSCNYNGTFIGCCETGTSGAYRGCKGYTTKQVSTDNGPATCTPDSCSPNYYCPGGTATCCTRSVATYSSTCSDGSTYREGGCYNYVTTSYYGPDSVACPQGGQRYMYSCVVCYAGGTFAQWGNVNDQYNGYYCGYYYQAPNYGTSCSLCGSTTTFISGGTANPSTGAGCDSYGFTCQTCSGGSITNNYYLQIIYSTAGSAAYTVYSTSSMLASQPTSIQVSTGNNTATVTPYNGGTSLGNFTATNTGTKGNGSGIVKAFAGTVNQATTVDNFSSTPLDIAPISATVEYLIVGGGGGGGNVAGASSYAGGGGAGGLLTGTVEVALNVAQNVTVGAGGAGGTYSSSPNGKQGNISIFGLSTAIGGGGGGRGTNSSGCYESVGGFGGSGGGGPCGGGAGAVGQGNNGGAAGQFSGGASGGGGAGGVGTENSGGAGVSSSITGAAVTYARGGYIWSHPGTTVANAGFGGGAASYQNNTSESGSSGVVVIAYPDTFPKLIITGTLTYTEPTRSGYRVYRFTGGSGTVIIDTVNVVADYLVVAGGGSGGDGGGGAGGLLTETTAIARNATTIITVGAGAAGGTQGTNGNNSALGTITATAGGGGAAGGDGYPGTSGGSGGGGGGNSSNDYTTSIGGNGVSGQGFAGGGGGGIPRGGNAGGGGGAGAVGQSGFTGVGNGGIGKQSSITGTATYYAGGGGGKPYNAFQESPGVGGLGGGGNSATWIGPYSVGSPRPSAATANTGGGGGGYVTLDGSSATRGAGGSGIVIISYPTSYGLALATTGSPTQTTVGSNYVYKFTGSGSITF